MADPTLALTFQDFIIRVAEYLGVAYYGAAGDQAAQVPVDAHDLDLVKRLVNDGYRRFINSNDKWQFLTPLITITFDTAGGAATVGGDISRYYLPAGFYGELLTPWTFAAGAGRFAIQECDEATIRNLYATNAATGTPSLIAMRPLFTNNTTTATAGKRWEALVWPNPDSNYVVTARARLYPDKLVNLSDVTCAGFQFDEAILACALAEAERQRNDTAGVQTANAIEAVARAKSIDRQSAPKRLGDYGDKSEDRNTYSRPSSYGAVDTYNNNPV